MKIEILTSNVKNEGMVREFIHRKVGLTLERMGAQVENVKVRLEDESVDSQAFDGLCRIEVKLQPRGQIHVSASGQSPSDCVLQATRKMEHAVKHEIDRGRQSSRTRHQIDSRALPETLKDDPVEDDRPVANDITESPTNT